MPTVELPDPGPPRFGSPDAQLLVDAAAVIGSLSGIDPASLPIEVFAGAATLEALKGELQHRWSAVPDVFPIHRELRLRSTPSAPPVVDIDDVSDDFSTLTADLPFAGVTVRWRLGLFRAPPPGAATAAVNLSPIPPGERFRCDPDACRRFCDVIGDPNPIHHDPAAAARAGMAQLALPGTLLAALLAAYAASAVGADAVRAYSIKFRSWVLAEEDIAVVHDGPSWSLVSARGVAATLQLPR